MRCVLSFTSEAARMTTAMEHMQSCPIVNRKSDIIKSTLFLSLQMNEEKNRTNSSFFHSDINKKRSAIEWFDACFEYVCDTLNWLIPLEPNQLQHKRFPCTDHPKRINFSLVKAELALNNSYYDAMPLIFCTENIGKKASLTDRA